MGKKAKRPKKVGSVYLRGKTWWIKYYVNGKPKYETSESEREEDADRLLKKRLGEIVTGRYRGVAPERTTLNQLFDLVVEDYRLKDQGSLNDVLSRLKHHLRPKLGHIRTAQFGSTALKQYIAVRKGEKSRFGRAPKPASINRELSILRRAFGLGYQHDPPLVMHVPHVEKLSEDNVRTGFLEKADYEKLLSELPGYLKLALVIGYHTGCRLGEVVGLQWKDVDLDGPEPTFTIPAHLAKNGRHRTIPIYGDMVAAVKRQKAERDEKYPALEWLFHDGTGVRLKSFNKAWKSACERAGLGKQLFHDLRRSAVRNMVRAGIPEKTAMAISGHLTRHVFDRYNIVTDRDLANAGAKLTEYLAAQPQGAGA